MLPRHNHRCRIPASLALLGFLGVGSICAIEAQVRREPPAIGNVTHYIRSISPLSGPVGTEVQVWMDGLPANTALHIALGEQHGCGYQVCSTTQTNSKGELAATLEIIEVEHVELPPPGS